MSAATPEVLSDDRLSQEEYDQYLELLADIPPPIAPLFSTAPPQSPLSIHSFSSGSSGSYRSNKRKRSEAESGSGSGSGSSDESDRPRKRANNRHSNNSDLLRYKVPLRVKRGKAPPDEMRQIYMDRGKSEKKEADRLPHFEGQAYRVSTHIKRLHHLGHSLINFAFSAVLGNVSMWESIRPVLEQAISMSQDLAKRYPSPRIDAWASYLYMYRNMLDMAVDRDHLKTLRLVLRQGKETLSEKAKSNANSATDITSPPSQGVKKETYSVQMSLGALTRYMNAVTNVRRGYGGSSVGAPVLKNLNPAILRKHFPRTFMRAFGPDGVGHTVESMLADCEDESEGGTTRSGESSQSPTPMRGPRTVMGPLLISDEIEIHDIDAEEARGGDFPYPHTVEDPIWVLMLGKSLITELDFYQMAEAERQKVDAMAHTGSWSPEKSEEPSNGKTEEPDTFVKREQSL